LDTLKNLILVNSRQNHKNSDDLFDLKIMFQFSPNARTNYSLPSDFLFNTLATMISLFSKNLFFPTDRESNRKIILSFWGLKMSNLGTLIGKVCAQGLSSLDLLRLSDWYKRKNA
jgi:hypothetical protein